MTVEKMIAKLKKMPKHAEVYWQDHDHGTYEWNDRVGSVSLVNYDERNEKVEQNFILSGNVVMLRN